MTSVDSTPTPTLHPLPYCHKYMCQWPVGFPHKGPVMRDCVPIKSYRERTVLTFYVSEVIMKISPSNCMLAVNVRIFVFDIKLCFNFIISSSRSLPLTRRCRIVQEMVGFVMASNHFRELCCKITRDDVMTWKCFAQYWTSVHRSPVALAKGQCRLPEVPHKSTVLLRSDVSRTNCWTNITVAGYLRRLDAHVTSW